MKIAYIARHNQTDSNDDEGAISYALTQLGHTVIPIGESNRIAYRIANTCDFCLFHKWSDIRQLRRIGVPKVFWYFDLVDFPDPILSNRCQQRKKWMDSVIPLVTLGFCTDGDWVTNNSSDKLRWLPQGADERMVLDKPPTLHNHATEKTIPILFVGNEQGGDARLSFFQEMRQRYGDDFSHVRYGQYREKLRDLITRTKIVVAPDGPATDLYWSNRIFLTLGFGGFLLHPYCAGLDRYYEDGIDYESYSNREQLHRLIKVYLNDPTFRKPIMVNGWKETKAKNLYRHRCQVIIDDVGKLIGNR